MAPRVYATADLVASIHKAHSKFTHVAVNISYASIKPVPFRGDKLDIEPESVFTWASWVPASFAQLERWRTGGGVFLDKNVAPDLIGTGATDALILAECPFTLEQIKRAVRAARDQVILPVPHTWRMHTECIELRAPSPEALAALWRAARGRKLTNLELATETGLPESQVQYLRGSLKPVETWDLRPRLAPEAPGLADAFAWIGAGRSVAPKDIRLAGYKAAIAELTRLGHIATTRYFTFPSTEPDWQLLERKRADALAELAAVRALVESIPDHLTS